MKTRTIIGCALASGCVGLAHGDFVQVRVTVENLAAENSVSFAPLRFGFHNGSYDSFNAGETATEAIVSIAEGGSGSAFFPAFKADQEDANLGSVFPNPPGPLLPGATGTTVINVDPDVNRYFTFGAMVVPSNDYFIGNDVPTQYMLFDENGDFVPTTIVQTASDLWDAGSEVDGVFGAAFLMGSSNDDHIDENGVVTADFKDLSIFDGETTAAGYVFDSQLAADTEVYRITFEIVPPVQVAVTVENLAAENSVSFAPLRFGFHNGTYDAFNAGETATDAIVSIAEGGSGSAYFPAFMEAQPDADLGSVLPNPAGPLLPGASGSGEFTVNGAVNRYFSFGAMVVPSNDYFVGNDAPTQYALFDDTGAFVPTTIVLTASDIWDAGSEVDGIFGAAFLMGSSNDDHIDENGVVTPDFKDLSIFDGATTAAGYVFDSQLSADTEVYRISFKLANTCPADLNGDGMVGGEDLGLLLADWGGTGASDLDGDGTVGGSDLGLLLAAWGGCP
ncbi:MAG: spondin domain-containing protein [Phycisphaerales bacterium]|nr:spondin domain-containing protein [Phycisphaerales bacterium]